MKVCNKLCNDCPFSNTSIPGFLADYTVDDFVKFYANEILFPCHKYVSEDTDVDTVQNLVRTEALPLCRGYAESYIKSCKVPKNLQFKQLLNETKSNLSNCSMSIFEFKSFHSL